MTAGMYYSEGDVGFTTAIKGFKWSSRIYPLGTTLMTEIIEYHGHSILTDRPLKHRHV
jgi:hypothetical protein